MHGGLICIASHPSVCLSVTGPTFRQDNNSESEPTCQFHKPLLGELKLYMFKEHWQAVALKMYLMEKTDLDPCDLDLHDLEPNDL